MPQASVRTLPPRYLPRAQEQHQESNQELSASTNEGVPGLGWQSARWCARQRHSSWADQQPVVGGTGKVPEPSDDAVVLAHGTVELDPDPGHAVNVVRNDEPDGARDAIPADLDPVARLPSSKSWAACLGRGKDETFWRRCWQEREWKTAEPLTHRCRSPPNPQAA